MDIVEKQSIEDVVDQYYDYLPGSTREIKMEKLEQEIENFFDGYEKNQLSDIFHDSVAFESIHTLAYIAILIQASSAGAERSFSALKLIETPQRTTMGQGRLSGLSIIYLNKNMIPSEEEVMELCVSCFAKIGIYL